MKKALFLLMYSLSLLLAITSYAQEPTVQNTLKRPHRIYFGPEFLWFQSDVHVKDAHVDDQSLFWGMRLGYDYLKAQSFYAGAELLAVNSQHSFVFSENGNNHHPSRRQGFGNLQMRLGYTVEKRDALLTPFLGLGVYSLSKYSHEGFKESMGYLAAGLRSCYKRSSLCAVGLNGEVFRSLGNLDKTVTVGHTQYKTHSGSWGAKIEAPVTIRISQGWDMQISPSYLRLCFSESQNIYGAGLLFGYKF